MTKTDVFIDGYPIVITTVKSKVKHNKNRRIQKKWAKKQQTFDFQEDNNIVFVNGCYYMNEKTFQILNDLLPHMREILNVPIKEEKVYDETGNRK